MNLAIHLLIKNNQKTIQKTLESILSLGKIYCYDIGCTDNTSKICQQYGIFSNKIKFNNDYSEIRNEMIFDTKEEWILVVEAWETIINWIEPKEPNVYRLHIVQDNIISKQIRLWHRSFNLKFTNPVYETIIYPEAENLNIYLNSTDGWTDNEKIVKKWKENKPLAVEPLYYESCILLMNQKWEEFLKIANYYIFKEKKIKTALIMTYYYCAMVYCYITKDYKKSLENLIICLAEMPMMAEFWCLLGDIYYSTKQPEKAKIFYENAIILGSRRLKSDTYPIEINKYKEYPNKMIEKCEKLKISYYS